MFMPSLSPMLRSVPRTSDINLLARVHGTSGSLDIDTVSASMHRYLSVLASGHIDNPMDFNSMNGRVDIDGTLTDVNFIKPTLLEAKMAREVNIPPTRIKGRINYSPGLVDGKVAVITGKGNMALDGRWQQKAKGYDATLDIKDFPVASFMPSLGVGNVTLTAKAKGHGYDVFSPATSLTAAVNLGSAVYNGEELRNVSVNARLDKSMLNADILSRNPALDMDATLSCDLAQGDYRWRLDGDVQHIDLQSFHLADNTMFGAMQARFRRLFRPAHRLHRRTRHRKPSGLDAGRRPHYSAGNHSLVQSRLDNLGQTHHGRSHSRFPCPVQSRLSYAIDHSHFREP